MELITKEFVKIPNWFFDEVLPTAPNSFSVVLAYIFRKTVGWHDTEFETTLSQIADATNVDKETVSRWLWTLALVNWIEYQPAQNGGGKSIIRISSSIETKTHIDDVVGAINYARRLIRNHWMVDGKRRTHVDGSCFTFRELVKEFLLNVAPDSHGWKEYDATGKPARTATEAACEDFVSKVDRELEQAEQEYQRRQAEKPPAPSGSSAKRER